MTTNLIPLITKIELDITIDQFLENWYDKRDDEPTQKDYENYCFQHAEAIEHYFGGYDNITLECKDT